MKKIFTVLPTPFTLLKSVWAILFILICSAANAFAEESTHMIPIPLEERVKQSSLIIEGEVISQNSFWDSRRQNIYTSNVIKVYKIFKGELQEQQVELITEGGGIGLQRHVYSTGLKLSLHQQGMFFLQDQESLKNTPAKLARSTRAYGSQQGLIAYDIRLNRAADAFNTFSSIESVYSIIANHTKIKFRTLSQNDKLLQAQLVQTQKEGAQFAPAITSFTPEVTSAGTRSILTINGTGFGSTRGEGFVEFRNADDGGKTFTKPYPREYISWSDTQIKLYIPSSGQDQGTPGSGAFRVTANDGTSSASNSPLTIEFVHSSVSVSNVPVNKNRPISPTMIDNDGTGGYTIQYAPSMQNRVNAQYGFQRAVTSWICSTGVNWQIGEGTNDETTGDDDKNTVRFAPNSEVGDKVLARTISRYIGFRCGSDTLFFLNEFDMEINSSISWEYGPGPPGPGQYDFETVMLHELGHAHQLGHVIRPREALMHYSVESSRTYRDLSPADLEGGNYIMGLSTRNFACTGLPVDPMIPIPESECNVFANITNQELKFLDTNVIQISWTSTEENGVDYYVVQRSSNGVDYTDIGTVDTKGNNSIYLVEDTDPLPLRSYYRIAVVYSDNTTRYSTRLSYTDPESLNRVFVGPNPVDGNGKINIIYLTEATIKVSYQLYDINGKLVTEDDMTFNESLSRTSIDMSRLASGMYLLKWTVRGTSGTEKIIKH